MEINLLSLKVAFLKKSKRYSELPNIPHLLSISYAIVILLISKRAEKPVFPLVVSFEGLISRAAARCKLLIIFCSVKLLHLSRTHMSKALHFDNLFQKIARTVL